MAARTASTGSRPPRQHRQHFHITDDVSWQDRRSTPRNSTYILSHGCFTTRFVRALRSFQEINVKVNNYIHSLHAEGREPYCEQTSSLKANVENRFSNVIHFSHAYIFCAEKLFKDNEHNTQMQNTYSVYLLSPSYFSRNQRTRYPHNS